MSMSFPFIYFNVWKKKKRKRNSHNILLLLLICTFRSFWKMNLRITQRKCSRWRSKFIIKFHLISHFFASSKEVWIYWSQMSDTNRGKERARVREEEQRERWHENLRHWQWDTGENVQEWKQRSRCRNEWKHINKMCNKFKMNLQTHVCWDSRFFFFFHFVVVVVVTVNILPIHPVCIEFGCLFISMRLWNSARALLAWWSQNAMKIIRSYVHICRSNSSSATDT